MALSRVAIDHHDRIIASHCDRLVVHHHDKNFARMISLSVFSSDGQLLEAYTSDRPYPYSDIEKIEFCGLAMDNKHNIYICDCVKIIRLFAVP